jgi:hypothetical protein
MQKFATPKYHDVPPKLRRLSAQRNALAASSVSFSDCPAAAGTIATLMSEHRRVPQAALAIKLHWLPILVEEDAMSHGSSRQRHNGLAKTPVGLYLTYAGFTAHPQRKIRKLAAYPRLPRRTRRRTKGLMPRRCSDIGRGFVWCSGASFFR